MTVMTEQAFQNDTNKPGYFVAGTILGSLIGGLVGAGVMLLLAPQSGEKTRKQMRRKSRDLLRVHTTDTIEDGADAVRTKSHEATNILHHQAETLQQRSDDFVDQQKERWSPVVKAGVTAVNNA